MEDTTLQPQMPVRRFDVFAEYNRLSGLTEGMDDAHAKGYGLWVAKVVASGRRRAAAHVEPSGARGAGGEGGVQREEPAEEEPAEEEPAEQEWHVLGGEPQTAALFDREIVQRMGADFYAQVFAPAIAQAVWRGDSYERIRDAIRTHWTPQH